MCVLCIKNKGWCQTKFCSGEIWRREMTDYEIFFMELSKEPRDGCSLVKKFSLGALSHDGPSRQQLFQLQFYGVTRLPSAPYDGFLRPLFVPNNLSSYGALKAFEATKVSFRCSRYVPTIFRYILLNVLWPTPRYLLNTFNSEGV